MMDKIKWYLICFLAGAILAYFFIPKLPAVKVITQTKIITKKVVENKDRIINREITKYKDGTEKIVEKEVIKDRIITNEIEKEKIIDKTINYTSSLGVGINPFNIYEVGLVGELQLFGLLWLGDIFSINIKNGEIKTFIFLSCKF